MRIAQEEIFGPVLVVIPFDDDDDAVRIANDSIFRPVRRSRLGLAGTGARHRPPYPHRHVLGQRPPTTSPPTRRSGGYKQSGIGREMGVEGFEEYLQTKSVAVPA